MPSVQLYDTTLRDGSQKEETCFIDCRAYAGRAETINKYMSKGRPIFVEGRLDFDTWTTQDGSKRSKHRVTVEGFQFIGAPPGQSANQTGTNYDRQAPYQNGTGQDSQTQQQAGAPEDDIPF